MAHAASLAAQAALLAAEGAVLATAADPATLTVGELAGADLAARPGGPASRRSTWSASGRARR